MDVPGIRRIVGGLDATGLRFAVVVSRFNAFITERLRDAALDVLLRQGAREHDVTVVSIPGAFELPQTIARLLAYGGYDAVVALGCLMRGDTLHFDLIATEVTHGLAELARANTIPIAFGVLTTDTLEQAIHRAGGKAGNKGAEAALAAIEQANLVRQFDVSAKPPAVRAVDPRA